jgi:PIN domain
VRSAVLLSLAMFKILVDTCVWLDVAKDVQQQPLLSIIEDLYQLGHLRLLVPDIVRAEFARNKTRVIEESGRSLSSALKRAKEAIALFGDGHQKRAALDQLHEVDQKLPRLGEAVAQSVGRIEKLLEAGEQIATSDATKLRAAQRALECKAPFHRQRNGINDAVLIEMYADVTSVRYALPCRFAFVTHNTRDFSHPTQSDREPHPDIAGVFSKIRSLYFIKLAEAIQRVEPSMVSGLMIEHESKYEPRRLSEIVDAVDEILDKIWYNRHLVWREKVELGEIQLVEKETFPVKDYSKRPIQRDIWEGALRSAKKVEKKYGRDSLGPYSDFDWGMMNGKLSALRWVLGEDWDVLDT